MLKRGQIIDLTIQKTITGGDGLGHCDGIAVMVPYAVTGDVLSVQVEETKKNFARAKIAAIKSPSPSRIVPQCPYHYMPSGRQGLHCGGCNLQMMTYKEQIESKKSIVSDLFRFDVSEIKPSPEQFRYRNKVQMPLGGRPGMVKIGFFAPYSHDIVDISDCLLQTTTANEIIAALREIINGLKIPPYDEVTGSGLLRHILLRQSMAFGTFMFVFVVKRDMPGLLEEIAKEITGKFPQVVSVHKNINPARTNVIMGRDTRRIHGTDVIREKIGEKVYEISPASFFQVNSAQTANLYDTVKELAGLTGIETVTDVYSGSGGIALHLAGLCKKVTGIEEVAPAVEDARRNASINSVRNAEFLCGTAEEILGRAGLPWGGVFVLDPPRSGCSEKVLESVMNARPEKIVYTSCNPATLRRDVMLMSGSYQLDGLRLVDMFPNTAHVECVAKLARK